MAHDSESTLTVQTDRQADAVPDQTTRELQFLQLHVIDAATAATHDASRDTAASTTIRDADARLARGQAHLIAADHDRDARRLQSAHEDFSAAARGYVVGAVQYQQGLQMGESAAASLDLERAIGHLGGRLRAEAQAALADTHRHPDCGLDPTRRLAEDLRERVAYAVPQLFDRSPDAGRAASTERPTRSR